MTKLVADSVDVAGRELSILRPPDAEALLDEEAFEREEFLPYWAELWPSGVALAREVATRPVAGLRVVELGCGLGLPSLAAAIGGARVLATDWTPDAIELLRRTRTATAPSWTCSCARGPTHCLSSSAGRSTSCSPPTSSTGGGTSTSCFRSCHGWSPPATSRSPIPGGRI